MRLELIDLDGSVARQATLPLIAPWESVDVVAMRDLASALRLWSSCATMARARARLRRDPPAAHPPTITLLGSGDYHHLAPLLIERARAPVTLIHFDNHPDWTRHAPAWHCGSWVNRALRLPEVAKVITIGPCSSDLVRPELKGANLAALASGRLVLIPWRHPPSRVWRAIPDGPGHAYRDGHLHWRNLAERPLDPALTEIISLIPTELVWLSIDKDVLPSDTAVTNWDQGGMPLAALVTAIRRLGAERTIAGVDICGEYSEARHRNPIKRIEAWIDQPASAPVHPDWLAQNERVNGTLLSALHEACACS